MIPGFGKRSITLGSSSECDLRVGGPGVLPEHAHVRRATDGHLVWENRAGKTRVGEQKLGEGASWQIDFGAQVVIGEGTPVPLAHPMLGAMLLEQGTLEPSGNELSLGRDASRNSVVVAHPGVSGVHAHLSRSPLSARDRGSSGGTWVDGNRLSGSAPGSIGPHSIVHLGPVPLAASLLQQLLDTRLGAAPRREATEALGAPTGGGRHRTVIGQVLSAEGGPQQQSIGRTADNDIRVEHPQVSSRHALLHRVDGQLLIEDRGSANGTYVRGKRIAVGTRVSVSPGEKVFVGPMPLLLEAEAGGAEVAVVIEDQSERWAGRPLYDIEAWDLAVQVPHRDKPNETFTLLDHVSFKALPGDFIALMGPSGAGKTTLLLALNGYLPPTHGQVRINGEDLYSIYDALRGSIGYVPQDDIVHPELTVWEAVRYSATFRLPPDYSKNEIDRRVSTTLQQLDLEAVQHLQIGRPENKVLSGGQRKRVNIAMELVTDPVLMFLDEPTSGLAADDTTALVQLLSQLAKDTGKTIIATIHQPAKDEFEKFNLALIMGQGGLLVYYGPTQPDAYRFFGSFKRERGELDDIDNPRDMFDMFKQRETLVLDELQARDPSTRRDTARRKAAQQWKQSFFQNGNLTFQRMYSGARQVGTGGNAAGLPHGRPKTRGQFWMLLARYVKIKRRDKSGSAIMLLQAPVIGVLLALVFGQQKEAVPYWCLGALQDLSQRSGQGPDSFKQDLSALLATSDNAAAIFFLAVTAVWFGTSNAAREIVAERSVYLRERMVNLGLFNYVMSKFLVLSLVTVVQCAVLLSIVSFSLGFSGGWEAFGIELSTLIATATTAVAIGLLLSTVVQSSEAAMALTPIALIPQVVLGGLIVPMTTNPWLKWPMLLMPARWGFQGTVAQERLAVARDPAWLIDLKKPDLSSIDNFIERGVFHCAEAQIASDELNGAWGFLHYETSWLPFAVLGGTTATVLTATLWILRQRDRI